MTSDLQILEYNNAVQNLQKVNELVAGYKPIVGQTETQVRESYDQLFALQEQAYKRMRAAGYALLNIGRNEKEESKPEGLGNYHSEISFEKALDELHDAAHEHKAHPSRATSKR